jgi:hypothetical protein
MAQGQVIRLYPRSEGEFRVQLREIRFSPGKIEDTVELIREEVGNFRALDVVSVFLTPEGRVILPGKRLEAWRRNES